LALPFSGRKRRIAAEFLGMGTEFHYFSVLAPQWRVFFGLARFVYAGREPPRPKANIGE